MSDRKRQTIPLADFVRAYDLFKQGGIESVHDMFGADPKNYANLLRRFQTAGLIELKHKARFECSEAQEKVIDRAIAGIQRLAQNDPVVIHGVVRELSKLRRELLTK